MSRNKPVTKLAVVDIETLDKTPSAIIFAIGCVVIDIQQLEIVNEFYTVVNPNQKGRTAGNGTPEWWLKQSVESPEAFKQLQASYGVSKTLEFVLRDFELFLIEEFGAEKVNMFGNGPEFDNVILDDAFAWAGLKTPWPYWGNQSIRTSNLLMQIAGVKVEREFIGIKHHALDDAHHEANLLIDALKLFKPAVNYTPKNPVYDELDLYHSDQDNTDRESIIDDFCFSGGSWRGREKNPVYVAPTKQIAEEWANHHVEFKKNSFAINTTLTSENFKAAYTSAEQAVKKLSDAFSKGINIENEQQKESADPYVDAVRSIYGALDSVGEEWRKPNQETRQSAVEKVREMAALINAFDMGELQDSQKHMENITAKLRSDGFDVKSPAHVDSCVQSLTFENESLKERAHCFDELQKLLKTVCEGSFERECASSLLDDCKHAISALVEYKSKYMVLKSKHL